MKDTSVYWTIFMVTVHYSYMLYIHVRVAPYGIREGRRKLGSKNATPNPVPPEQ